MLRKVIVADDNAVNRRLLERMLSAEYEVLIACDGAEALALLRKHGESVSAVLLDIVMPVVNGYEVLAKMRSDEALANIPVIVATGNTDIDAELKALSLGANDYVAKPYNPAVIKHRLRNTINMRETAAFVNAIQRDKLTGLYNRETFFSKAEEMIASKEPGYFVMSCFDIDNFKLINDRYGNAKGDEILIRLAKIFRDGFDPIGGVCGRVTGDNFAVLYPKSFMHSAEVAAIRRATERPLPDIRPLSYSIGRYVITDTSLSGGAMYDRACIAEESVKARFDVSIAEYDETMRENMLKEQEIVNEMDNALKDGQFEVWLQPQYNHSTGALIGAEALVRWRHPRKGLIPPGEFIPVFERNGFVYEMDKYVWEQVCAMQKSWQEQGRNALPVSVNVSRYDIFRDDFFESITGLVKSYGIDIDHLRLEITESAFAKSTDQIIAMVKRLIAHGFTVEIDDFGSGYSSLNTLKDVPADILKLDMRFLENDENSTRGGSILESVIRMARWLGMPVIAEGVETKEQADYLKSIGCSYVQGYLYAKPMPAAEYEELTYSAPKEHAMKAMETIKTLNNNAFWDPRSMETLIFNSYVGGACILEYYNGRIEFLRANEKYKAELGGDALSLEETLAIDPCDYMDCENRSLFNETIKDAADTDVEKTCELCLRGLKHAKGPSYFRITARVIARAGERLLVYCSIINLTAQRQAEQEGRELTDRLKIIMNSINGGVTATTISEEGHVSFVFANDRYFAMIEYTREQFAKEVKDTFQLVHPDDRENTRARMAQVLKDEVPDSFECRVIKRGGEVMHMRCNAAITHMAGVADNVLLSVCMDITSERESERSIIRSAEQLRFLNQTAHDLLAHADVDAGITGVLYRVLNYFGGSRAYVFEFNRDERVAKNTYEVCASGIISEKESHQKVPFSEMELWFSAFETCGFVILDGGDAPDDLSEVPKEGSLGSLVAVPLRQDGALTGYIGVDGPTRHQAHVAQLQAIGDYIAVMLARRALNVKIESDSKAILALMNDTPGGFVRMRRKQNGVFVPVYVNQGFCDLVGMTAEQVLEVYRESAVYGIPEKDLHVVEAAIDEMYAKGEAKSGRYRLKKGDGSFIWVMIFGRMTTDDAGDTYLNVYYTDASEQAREEEAAKESERILQLAAAHSNRLIYRYDIKTKTISAADSVNGLWLTDLSTPESAVENAKVMPESTADFLRVFREIHSGQKEGGAKLRIRADDGISRWFDMKYSLVSTGAEPPTSAVISFLDITDDHEKELAYERYRQTINDSFEKGGRLAYFEADITSDTTEKFGGLILLPQTPLNHIKRTEIVTYVAQRYVLGNDREKCRLFFSRENLITQFTDGVRTLSDEWSAVLPGGRPGFVRSELQMVQDPYTGHIKAYTILKDITGEKRAELDIKKKAERDGMTGLFNKVTTQALITQRLRVGDERDCALLLVDLDDLKGINDTLGHDVGDEAIKAISSTLRTQFRKSDIAGRVGGDEFVVFLDGLGSDSRLQSIMTSFMDRLSASRYTGAGGRALCASVGIAVGRTGVDTFDSLFRKADKALYHAKSSGRNNYAIYAPDMEG